MRVILILQLALISVGCGALEKKSDDSKKDAGTESPEGILIDLESVDQLKLQEILTLDVPDSVSGQGDGVTAEQLQTGLLATKSYEACMLRQELRYRQSQLEEIASKLCFVDVAGKGRKIGDKFSVQVDMSGMMANMQESMITDCVETTTDTDVPVGMTKEEYCENMVNEMTTEPDEGSTFDIKVWVHKGKADNVLVKLCFEDQLDTVVNIVGINENGVKGTFKIAYGDDLSDFELAGFFDKNFTKTGRETLRVKERYADSIQQFTEISSYFSSLAPSGLSFVNFARKGGTYSQAGAARINDLAGNILLREKVTQIGDAAAWYRAYFDNQGTTLPADVSPLFEPGGSLYVEASDVPKFLKDFQITDFEESWDCSGADANDKILDFETDLKGCFELMDLVTEEACDLGFDPGLVESILEDDLNDGYENFEELPDFDTL